ncbi:MAG: hypothetical protein Q7J08_00205 [Methanocorpusculum sp.]|uniref:hypothetical protein n=1 Tax=Methanocorpusculum sp. TaxID=2058474 RepID=UPI002717227A|nr:hypothetical protein [Methanocorpusculum sp.]MDO9522128.1 hypothetical protein [Methanocorpusculum sp.]
MSEKDNEVEVDFTILEKDVLYFSGMTYVFNEKQVSHIEGAEEAFPKGYGDSELYPDRPQDEIPAMQICITQKHMDSIEEQRKKLNIEWDACLARIFALGFAAAAADGQSL